jgi:hypothetical protein
MTRGYGISCSRGIDDVVDALEVFRQRLVNMSCRNCSVTGGNCDLVEIRHDVSGSIDSGHGRTLTTIHFKASDVVRLCAQGGRQVGSDSAAERRIDDIERQSLNAPQHRANAISAMLDGADRSRHFYAGFAKGLGRFIFATSPIKAQQCDVVRIGAQESGLVDASSPRLRTPIR